MIFLFAFIQSFGWISTIFLNDLIVNSTVGMFGILAFDIFVAPGVGIWMIVYCFAGIEGYDGKGCAGGINGLIPTNSPSDPNAT